MAARVCSPCLSAVAGRGWAQRSAHRALLTLRASLGVTRKALCETAKSRGQRHRRERRQMTEKQLARWFVDERTVKVSGGRGGDGMCAFHSEPRKEFGGPDGGNGGRGGDVIMVADRMVRSLSGVSRLYRGHDGTSGASDKCFGRNGKDKFLHVPVGTVVREAGSLVADLNEQGEEVVVARGGVGGRGNHSFLTNDNRAPTTAEKGTEGEERTLKLEIRTMAHFGLVGFPNAGKSSLLRALTNARPAVGDYPFTTLHPHVGIVEYRDYTQIAVADIPGIVVGAHVGRGLGLSFLRHVERCRALLCVVDLSAAAPARRLFELRRELALHEPSLALAPHAVVGAKLDLPGARDALTRLADELAADEEGGGGGGAAAAAVVVGVSAKTGENVGRLAAFLRREFDGAEEEE
uniref:Mitochondrial ribosome-associated GTPase 2 n=1 Tax=Petromyzon marinus TaxID=7757 RepID=A0AAJ7UK16_PETMA|nr:mitochondrial ribosome-associated GTPase 2 [Petromyzon marinus]XP_032836147.1 mitochondrial ribosome-associated GTPase 2 [Petromyzon marinus]XP_032836148.1 mitochondrial ribosome-associated GTPase 2 [Petromyzon marinus]XP_032836149.1 mitochondrial ribosome-associated GTPase 2 [Petromyzon marinus]XP_032836150.1 mitochondrial ribosome-associated GTPase 2 [Petromyzon marinus]XP_032836151.1 mitochondrial ribosome-associated GTPase 2 [Petromyzon marinus]